MKKRRSRTYLKSQRNKAVKYYFENPDTTLKCLGEKFRVNQDKLSKDISQKLEERFKNSISQKNK
jgi:predicted HTH transcriptional regulator